MGGLVVRIVETVPHHTVVKRQICKKCGVTLEYVPLDVKYYDKSDYTGDSDRYYYITCPTCGHTVLVETPRC